MYLISETFRFSHIIKKTVTYSLETVSYRSSFMWADLPKDCKYQNSSQGKGKEWNAEICACRLCRLKKETLVLFRCYLKKSNLQCKSKGAIISIINIVLYLFLYIIFCPVPIGLLIAFTICCKCSVGKFLFCLVNGQA